MTWLIIIIALIVYIAIGQFVAGMIPTDNIGDVVCLIIIWPVVSFVLLLYLPFSGLRKLGSRFSDWLENHGYLG